MPLDLLLTSDLLDVHHDKDHGWLYLDWKGPQDLALVQAACQQITGLIRQLHIHKVLNDNTHITQTSWELVRWVASDYLPEAGRAGLAYVAWVPSPLLDCRSNVHRMSDLAVRKPQVAICDDLAAAYSWLMSANVLVAP